MKSARVTLPEEPPNDVTAGLDWARDDHALAILDGRGRELMRELIPHSGAGLKKLRDVLRRHGVREVAIERGDGPVVDALLEADITVVVINPNQVKNLRSRYGSAGNKDDRFDAYVLADVLRTDRARLSVLQPDSDATVSLRRTCRARRDLVEHRVAVANQLRAHLNNVMPAAVGLFSELDSAVSLAFIARFDCQERLDWLSPKRLAAWLSSVGYSGRKTPDYLHAHLKTAPRGLTGIAGRSEAFITQAMLAVLETLTTQIKALAEQIKEQLALHPDQHIFTSLPRAGQIRAARLLAEIGDCRARFPNPESLICLAGAAPVTKQSGKSHVVTFRWACDKELRDAVQDFAADSRHSNAWAAHLYSNARARGHDHPHAVRILARAWLFVIWHCWQDETPYQPQRHRALQRVITQSETQAA